MLSHFEIKDPKIALALGAACPPLAGKTFKIFDGLQNPVQVGTVTIAADLSYTVTIAGQPNQTGQLTLDPASGNYRYKETNPAVSGGLFCVAGRWYFLDDKPGTGAGSIAP
ncbi:MAG: hypothetical protein AAGF54_20240 [Pseudomonadota bacterium]